ncbi:MAG: cytochrome c [Burkholderiales bacterium]
MKKITMMVCGAVLMMSGHAMAGNPAAGKEIAKKTCAACHGADGNSASADFPKLSGQHYDYLVKSMQGYKSGVRKNPIMAPMAANLSQRDIEDLAAYFSSQQGLVTFK